MAKPAPSPAQQELIDAEIEKKNKEIAKFNALIPGLDAQIAEKTEIDNAFKAQFNWYNDTVIGNYEAEREAINGVYVTNPVTNQDIEDVVFDPTNARMFPPPGDTEVVRISQFDGTPTSTAGNESNTELYWLDAQANIEDILVNGLNSPSDDLDDVETVDSVSNSTPIQTIELTDSASATVPELSPGEQFILTDGTNYIPVEVISSTSTPNGTCDLPAYETESECTLNGGVWTPAPGGTIIVQIQILTAAVPVTLAAGASIIDDFSGFNNTERDNKTALEQNLMDYLVAELQAIIGKRQERMAAQSTALAAQEDPDLDPTAATNITTSDDFLTDYLIDTDISDVGIGELSTERTTRTGQANARVAAINAAFTGGSENYYDSRYTRANDRAQIRRGTLTEINRLQIAKDSFAQQSGDRAEAVASLESI